MVEALTVSAFIFQLLCFLYIDFKFMSSAFSSVYCVKLPQTRQLYGLIMGSNPLKSTRIIITI